MRKLLPSVVALGLVTALAAACGGGAEKTVEIASPGPGDVVSVPFDITLETSVPLGPSTFDLHHVHLWFDDDPNAYVVIEKDVAQVNNAPDGEHEMFVSLRHADHSAAGAEASIRLVISGGSTTAGPPAPAG